MRWARGPALPAGTVPSPNIWESPEIYETENRAVDPDGVIDAAIAELVARARAGLAGDSWGHVIDVGCGSGYHLPRLAAVATAVTGVEPHPALADAAARRVAGLLYVTVRQGTAQALPLPDSCVDVAHARWAYFFGPGCEPGLRELARVARPGALAVIVDHDATRSSVGRAFAAGLRADGKPYDPSAVEAFWARQGFARTPLDVRWRFASSADLAAVLRIEFPREVADAAMAEIAAARAGIVDHYGDGAGDGPGGRTWDVDAAVNVWHRRY